MNREDIVRMAREAGIGWLERAEGTPEFLERFANLVAAAERNDGIQLKNIEHPISLGDASDYKFSSESIEEGWLQREWQGLTEDEIKEAMDANCYPEYSPFSAVRVLPYSFARAIEAKLKEKNGG